ncbi:phosphatases II [Hypoxylon crocopeplum]|nr:phosphatases II [Hypoxylon crocopeplum]
MDHLPARFRRTKRTASASPATSFFSGSPPDRSTSESKLGHPNQREQPPTLAIPASQSIRHDSASKSPFRRGFYFRPSHKRARSPTPTTVPPPVTPVPICYCGETGSDESAPMAMEVKSEVKGDEVKGDEVKGEEEAAKEMAKPEPKMPAFLSLSQQEIEAKFHDLSWLERFRVQESIQNPSPNFRFARVTAPEAKVLDRYANIQPWANNRVKLQVPEGKLDYINASPVVLHSPLNPQAKPPHRYIVMQGPKFGTMDHVWRMVVEQLKGPAVIVMLTETHEGAMEKCFPYFPRTVDEEPCQIGERDEFDDGFLAEVKCVSVEEHADGAIVMRKLNVHVDGREEDMTVWHLLYRKWPDFGVPALEDIDSFFELMRLSREKNACEDNPRIVHCSAGVGRSGTFIALEHLMREVDSGDLDHYETMDDKEEGDIIYKTVDALREQRKQMVQAESQYAFLYRVLRKLWLEKHGLEEDIQEPAAKRLELDPFC